MDIFDLSAKITLDSSGFEKDVNQAGSAMDGLSAKAVALGNAIYDIGKKFASSISQLSKAALNGYADFEQLTGGIETLFKASSATVQTYADNAYKTAGISANQYMETATSFAGALLQSLGNDTAAAASYADRAITDMSDNANKMGTAMDSIIATYQSLSRGNYAMLDNLKLGYGGTKAELERLLEDADALSESFNLMYDENGKVSYSFADIVDAIHIVQTEMDITGTTALEASETISGSVASMKAAWENWLVGLGDENADLSGLTDNLIASVETAVGNIMPVMSRIKESLAKVFIDVFSDLTGIDLTPVLDKFNSLKDGISETISGIFNTFKSDGFSGALQTIGDMIGGVVDSIIQKFKGLTSIDLSGFTGIFSTIIETISSILSSIDFSGVLSAVGNVASAISDAFSAIDLSAIGEIVGNLVNLVADAISSIDFSTITETISGMVSEIQTSFDELKNAFSEGGFSGLLDGLLSEFEKLTGIDMTSFAGGLQTLVSGLDGFVSGGFEGAFDGILSSLEGLTGLDLGGLKDNFSGVGKALDEVAKAFSEGGVSGALGELATQFENLTGIDIVGVFEGISSAIQNVVSAFREGGISGAIDELIAKFSEITGIDFGPFVSAVANLFTGIADYLSAVWDQIEPLRTDFVALLLSGFEQIKNSFSSLGSIITETIDFIGNLFHGFADGLRGDFDGMAEHFGDAFGNIKDVIETIIEDIKQSFEGLVSWVKGVGERMWQGLSEGFSSAVDAISGVGEKIKTGFKDLFGIHSPSRVFAEYGRYMAEGLGIGWNSEIDSIVRNMSDGVKINGAVDFSSSAIGKSSSATVNGIMAASSQASGGAYNINLVVDGRTLANVMFDPLNNVARQKGVALGA